MLGFVRTLSPSAANYRFGLSVVTGAVVSGACVSAALLTASEEFCCAAGAVVCVFFLEPPLTKARIRKKRRIRQRIGTAIFRML